ncbi:hypothetical protein TNCV_4896281 [Trichonephila clavipes]|uniref:Uncharacterized protein n=1 Tax=Trichonephila clavipes TaxID=2585209 RepID=A0A8X6VWN0_TRICX|nr:hypothetical protein TNCV_4896281 [Trichonephila clavipes]
MYSAFAAWGYSKQPSSCKSSREIGGRGGEEGQKRSPVRFDTSLFSKPRNETVGYRQDLLVPKEELHKLGFKDEFETNGVTKNKRLIETNSTPP